MLTEVNSVTIDTSPNPGHDLHFHLDGGPLGPDNFSQPDGSSEIEFTVTGFTAASHLGIRGTNGEDHISLGQSTDPLTGITVRQVNFNGAADGGSPDVDLSFTQPPGSSNVQTDAGNDVVSGAGIGGFVLGGPTSVSLTVTPGTGSNQVTGGSGNDLIGLTATTDGDGGDRLSGGLGADLLSVAALPGAGFSAVPLRVSLDGVANDGSNCPGAACNGDNVLPDFETLLGSDNGDEVLVGNKAPQGMIGNGGNDVLKGGGEADALDVQHRKCHRWWWRRQVRGLPRLRHRSRG